MLLPAILLANGQPPQVNYTETIRPILTRKCIGCHYSGGPSPFSLESYLEASERADLIQTVALVHSMPPVDAESEVGRYSPIEALSSEELIAIQSWVRTGRPEGPKQTTKAAEHASRFDRLRSEFQPSSLVKLGSPQGLRTRAEGRPYWQIVRVPTHSQTPIYVRGFRVRPADPFVLRQVQVYFDTYGAAEKLNGKETSNSPGVGARGLLGAWSAGYYETLLPEGAAMELKPNQSLFAQVQYVPNGKASDGGFTIELLTTKQQAALKPRWLTLGKRDFEMPWQFEFYTLSDEHVFLNDAYVSSILPEARNFATQIRVRISEPDGGNKLLLQISSWNRFWNGAYNLEKPVLIRKGSRVRMEIDYDNADHTTLQPGVKTATLRPGLGERDELCFVHLLCTPVQNEKKFPHR